MIQLHASIPTPPQAPTCTFNQIDLRTALTVENLKPEGVHDLLSKLSLGASGGKRNIGESVGEFAITQLMQSPAIRLSVHDVPVIIQKREGRFTARVNCDAQSNSWIKSALAPFETSVSSLGIKVLFSHSGQTAIDLDYLVYWMFMSGLSLYYDDTDTFAQAVAQQMSQGGINHELEIAKLSNSLFAYFSFEALQGWNLQNGVLQGEPHPGRQGAVGIHFHRPDFGALIAERVDATTTRNALLKTLGETTQRFHQVCDQAYD